MMRKTCLLLAALLLLLGTTSAFAETPDLSQMTFEELIELQTLINAEIFTRPEAGDFVLSVGEYLVGRDLQPGTYYAIYESGNAAATGRIYVYADEAKEKQLATISTQYDTYDVYRLSNLETGNVVVVISQSDSIHGGTKMKRILALLACFMCLMTAASAESLSLEDRIAALEARIATLEELLRALTAAPTQNENITVPAFTPGQNNPQFAEDAIWYHDAEKGIILECTDFYYNDTNHGEILWKFTVRNGSEHKVRFSAQNVYINGWLHSTAISSASMDELAPHSNMKDFIMLTSLLNGSIDGIETLVDIGRVQEIRFELVVRIDGREVERIPVIITDMSTLEEREGW